MPSNISPPSRRKCGLPLRSLQVHRYALITRSEALLFRSIISLGNIAIGNLQLFLPVIVRMVESDPKKRLLSLHALKEVHLFYLYPLPPSINQYSGCNTLLARAFRRRCRHAVGTSVRELRELGGDDQECCCCVPREAGYDSSFQVSASTPCMF